MRVFFLGLGLLASLACAAHATPPRILTVSEIPLAARDGRLLVLRFLEDNLGYHHTTLTSGFLVERALSGGADRMLPLSQELDHGADFLSYGVEARFARNALPPVDLAEFLARARSITPAHFLTDGTAGLALDVAATGLLVESFGATGHVSAAEIRDGFRQILTRTQAARPALPADLSPLQADGYDVALDPAEECVFPHLIRLDGDLAALFADCQSFDTGDRVMQYLPLILTRP